MQTHLGIGKDVYLLVLFLHQSLPDPDILASEIIENIEAGLESFREIMSTVSSEE